MTTDTETPAKVAELATESDMLDLGATALIGVAGPRDGMIALVRHPGGHVRRLRTGDRLFGGTVRAIDETGLLITRGAGTQRLALA